jgi:hypothetical protein
VHMWVCILVGVEQFMALCSEVEDICNLDCIEMSDMKRILLSGCSLY